MKINKINNDFLVLIFMLFPFWELITLQLNYYTKVPVSFFTSLKYLLVFIPIFLFLLKISGNTKVVLRKEGLLMSIYTLYVFFHIIGSNNFFLKVDGFKFEFLFPFFALFYLHDYFSTNVDYLHLFIKILFYQGLITLSLGTLEYFNQEILTTIYRQELDDIPHIYWFKVPRLISTAGNPINLGATLCIWIVSYIYMMKKKYSKVLNILFPLILLVTLFVVSMTLSRTSLIVFVFVVLLSFLIGMKGVFNKILFLSLLGFCSMIIVSIFLQGIDIAFLFDRFGNIFEGSEYTKNARVINWNYAINSMQPIEYLWGKGIGASTPNGEYVIKYNGYMIENGYMSTFINYGAIGALLYLAIIIRFSYLSILIKKHNNALGLFLILFLVVYGLFNTSNDYNRNLPYMLYFWVFYVYSEIEYLKIKDLIKEKKI